MSVVLANVTASKVTFMIDECNIDEIYFISLLKQKYTEEFKLLKRVISIV